MVRQIGRIGTMSDRQRRLDRLSKALRHEEGDRVPAGDSFWTGFMKACRRKWGEEFDPYRHFDLDYVIVSPNMDPRIQPFEILEEDGEDVVVKTGFGATIRRRSDLPMPHFDGFSVNQPEEMADFGFDDPDAPARFFEGGDDQLNGVGDALARDIPAWDERVDGYADDFPVFGSVCEPFEFLWRIIGSENALLWMGLEPEKLQAFVDRIGQFLYDLAVAEIRAGRGRLVGMYIWGDVAYVRGMLFGAPRWREMFAPHLKRLIDLCHEQELMVVYHGCGDASDIFDDLVEMGLDGYNPLEAKAGLDAVELKRKYAGKLAFVGNVDVRVLESNDLEKIENEVRYKLKAAVGGGWIFQSDHSVSSAVEPESYERAIETLRKYGNHPLQVEVRGDR
jgi:uroporphyrinogen decarboxylase